MRMKSAIEVLEIPRQELDALLEHARTALPDEDYRRLKAVVDGLSYLTELIADKDTTIRDLRRLLFPLLTEKTREVLRRAGVETAEKPAAKAEPSAADGHQGKKHGHGRNGADAYHGAQRIAIPHAELQAGDACPACIKGKIYLQQEPRRLVRISGQAPLTATVYELERLRCNLCGEVYTAQAPEEVGEEKYDETAAAMIAQMKYGSGMPFHRLERLEQNPGIPLPAATQWEIVEEAAELINHYLAHPDEAEAIARAGQERTLREHTYRKRMEELVPILQRHLERM